jgi:hypothetical protein
MKISHLIIICIAAAPAALSRPSFAGSDSHGGDICEDRIKIIRDDIGSWIYQGGAAALNFPDGISVDTYKTKMLEQILSARISCVETVLTVDGEEKTCENHHDTAGIPQVNCNFNRFNATNESEQYVLVHHEFAGLSGLEIADGPESEYKISNQITDYLQEQVVIKLMVGAKGPKFKTSTGAVFTYVKGPDNFGMAWRDPDGNLWSESQGDFDNLPIKPDNGYQIVDSAATRACAKIGGALPSSLEFTRLASFFERDETQTLTLQGLRDWATLFPNPHGEYLWSSTESYSDPLNNADFYYLKFSNDASEHDATNRSEKWIVRCITTEGK